MAFAFDKFINKPCIGYFDKKTGDCIQGIFGREVKYIPAQGDSFTMAGDFHKVYKAVDMDSNTAPITSSEIALYIRESEMPKFYPTAQQGDHVEVEEIRYQIIDIQKQISTKLILHVSE